MNSVTDVTGSKVTTKVQSCERCSVRKVKCDKQQPKCSACVKHNAECVYPLKSAPRRKRKRNGDENPPWRNQHERLLYQKGVPPDTPSETDASHKSPSQAETNTVILGNTASNQHLAGSSSSQPVRDNSKTRLVHNQTRSKYLDNRLWTRVVDELAEPTDALGHSSEDDDDHHDDDHDEEVPEDNIHFVLGLTPTPIGIETLHPSADQKLELWQVFLDNFDPLTKIVHGPTLQPIIQKVATNISTIPRSLEALLFSIYSAAVLSMSDSECNQIFAESRKILLSRYRLATKAALSRAKFISSTNLVVLQAFLIHLFSVRDINDSRTLWTFVGLALRIAEGMGLHRDGSYLGLSVFESEMRRRIWWQLRMLEGRSAELSGSDRFSSLDVDSRNPKPPANINDDELHPGLLSLPEEKNRATDMIFCSLRFEMRNYWTKRTIKQRQQGKEDNIWDSFGPNADMTERDQDIDQAEQLIETKYVRHCDPSQPLQLMALLVARGSINTMRLLSHHPRRWGDERQIPDSEREYLWELSIKLLQQANMIHKSDEIKRFSWHAAFYVQWHAFIQILDTLRTNPLVKKAVKVWQLIEEFYHFYPEFVTNIRKPLYIAVSNLCLKAYHARELALAKEGEPTPPVPSYIRQFREQREAANKRRSQQEASRKTSDGSRVSSSIPKSSSTYPTVPSDGSWTTSTMASSNVPQLSYNSSAHSLGTGQSRPPTDKDVWLPDQTSDQPNSLLAFTDDTPNIDFDKLFAQDTNVEDDLNQPIDWMRWDALIKDFT